MSERSAPRVSVVVPVYNRAGLLPAALRSVLAQTEGDFELIVADDGSTDGTRDLIERLAAQDRRIRMIVNAGPHGPGGARNAAAAAARAPWIAFLDSDDAWRPEKLARFLAAAVPGVALVGSDYAMLDRNRPERPIRTMTEFLFEVMTPWWEDTPSARRAVDCARLRADRTALADEATILGMAIGGWLWPQTSSVMVSRQSFERAGGFDASLTRTEDMDLWVRLLRQGRVAYIDEVLATYEITGRDGGTGERYASHDAARRPDRYREALWHLRFLERLPERAALTPEHRAFLRERLADHQRLCGRAAGTHRPARAAWHFARALSRSPAHRARLRKERLRYFSRD